MTTSRKALNKQEGSTGDMVVLGARADSPRHPWQADAILAPPSLPGECRYSKLSEKRTDKAVLAAICNLRVTVKQ